MISLGRGWLSVKVVGAWWSLLSTAGGGPGVGGSADRLVVLPIVERAKEEGDCGEEKGGEEKGEEERARMRMGWLGR